MCVRKRLTARWLAAACLSLALFRVVYAHPMILAKAALDFKADGHYTLAVQCDLAAIVMQTGTGHLDDLLAQELKTMPREDLRARIADATAFLKQQVKLDFDGKVAPPESIEMPTAEQLQAGQVAGTSPEATVFRILGRVPAGAKIFRITFPAEMQTVALTMRRPDAPLVNMPLAAGQASFPFPLGNITDQVPNEAEQPKATEHEIPAQGVPAQGESQHEPAVAEPSRFDIGLLYFKLGFEHILPLGLDHILFVLGLYLLSPELKPLLWQVTAFTVAHSVTLALSMYDVVSLPAEVVEPLIALSITFVAVENLFTTKLHVWRPIIVFVFGLLHGLGFAGVLTELGLPETEFVTALITFNVGVEFGQLAVIALAFLSIGWFRHKPWYHRGIVVPVSCVIAAIGLYWTVERVLGW